MSDRSQRPEFPPWHRDRRGLPKPEVSEVQKWLDSYVDAWRSYDEAAITDLWSDEAIWYRPFGVRAKGRKAITEAWMAEKDLFQPGGYDARYEPIAIDNGYAVTQGRTHFYDPETRQTRIEYDNIWLLRFDADGRCTEFHEWYSPLPDEQ